MQSFVTYKNIQVGFSSAGKGSVVVLLHGFLENSTMWNGITPTLSKRNRVITIDLLDHGDTECLGYVHTMEDQAKMVKFVLNHLKLRRFTIIGHSMGGYIALSFAHLFPENTKGICLLNATYQNDNRERKLLRSRAIKMAENNYENMVRISFTNLFSENSRTVFKSEIKKALIEALKTPVQGYIAAQEGMKIRKEFTSFFKNASFKKLVVIAKKDSVIDAKKVLLFTQKNNIPVSVLQEGHMSHIENKKKLIEVLKDFEK
ncbi:MAG: alpha/beta hydrolase [Flavobacteriaceae bacterium]|nr:alpha/beta hydrolase [Flavobacteriaceae bacterium]